MCAPRARPVREHPSAPAATMCARVPCQALRKRLTVKHPAMERRATGFGGAGGGELGGRGRASALAALAEAVVEAHAAQHGLAAQLELLLGSDTDSLVVSAPTRS